MEDLKKKENGGSTLLLNLLDKGKGGKKAQASKVLEYNNKDPESTLEQFLLPKERSLKKAETPDSDDVEFDFSELDPDILKRVESSDFNTYCASNVEIRSFWGKKLTVDQILSYSKSINAPILNIAKDVHSLALKNFKRITAIINEKVTKNASINIIKRMIKMAVKNSAEMRDEVFFQLVKQVRANNRQECCYLAWSLFCVISCFICPSESSIYYLLNYVKYVADNNRDDETRRSARFIFVRLLKNFLTKGRGVLPCSSEIELIKRKKKLSCRINLMTGGYLTVYFENYTVISDILKQICELMDIDKENYSKFGLFEITTKSGGLVEETWVEDFIKLADVVASWEHERLFYQRKLGINLEAKFNLYFRIRFFFPLDRKVFRDLLLEYNECCYMFKFCHCVLSIEELIELMGIHLQIFFGDHSEPKAEEIRKYIYEQIPRYDCKFTYKLGKEQLVVEVLKSYAEKKGLKRNEARLAFIEILSKKESYGRNYYTVKVDQLSHNLRELEDNLIIGLGEKNMRIFNRNYEKVLDIDYFDMQKWGYSDVLFTVLYGKKDDQPSKLVFQTVLSTCISFTLTTYCEGIMGISPKENNLVASATSKMIIAATEFFKRVNKFEMARLDDENSDEELVTGLQQ